MGLKNTKLSIEEFPIHVTGARVDIVVLYADIRNFSSWIQSVSPEQVAELIQIEYERVIQLSIDYYHTFHKYLGDGFLLIWEIDDSSSFENALSLSIGAAFEIHKKFWYVSQDLTYKPPEGLGIGISCGEAIRVQPESFIKELNEPDFIGYTMNCGARLQSISAPYGVILDSKASKIAEDYSANVLSHNSSRALHKFLIELTKKGKEAAGKLKGLYKDDINNFRHVVWPYMQDSLWCTDGRI